MAMRANPLIARSGQLSVRSRKYVSEMGISALEFEMC